jgi:ParB family transcriptional regulator, chromosome partitioning protein
MRKSATAVVGATGKVASRARGATATAVVGATAKVASRARTDTATAVVGDTAKVASRARRDMASEVQVVPLTKIVASARNPRRKRRNIEELAASMQAYGLLQPLVVRPQGGQFEVIAGHRRLEAAQLLGWTDLPVLIRKDAQDEAYLLTIIENLQRDDLTPREEAAALELLLRERGWTTVQVARAINRSQPYVSKRLRVFEDPVLAPAVLANKLSVSMAEELLGVKEERRYELAQQAVEQGWDRQRLRRAAKRKQTAKRASTRPPGLTRQLQALRLQLRDVEGSDLTEGDRRELRLLFNELAMLGRAPTTRQKRVFPALPKV